MTFRARETDTATKRMEAARRHRREKIDELLLLVSILSQHWPGSHLEPAATRQTEAWRWIVCLHSPAGQLCWHINEEELTLFDHLERTNTHHWDGHRRDDKIARMLALAID